MDRQEDVRGSAQRAPNVLPPTPAPSHWGWPSSCRTVPRAVGKAAVGAEPRRARRRTACMDWAEEVSVRPQGLGFVGDLGGGSRQDPSFLIG